MLSDASYGGRHDPQGHGHHDHEEHDPGVRKGLAERQCRLPNMRLRDVKDSNVWAEMTTNIFLGIFEVDDTVAMFIVWDHSAGSH